MIPMPGNDKCMVCRGMQVEKMRVSSSAFRLISAVILLIISSTIIVVKITSLLLRLQRRSWR